MEIVYHIETSIIEDWHKTEENCQCGIDCWDYW